MNVPFLLKIIPALYGLILGSFFPLTAVYLATFYRKRKFGGFKLIRQLILRFFLILLFYSIIIMPLIAIWDATQPGGFDLENEEIFPWYIKGFLVGFFGGVTMLIVGFRVGKKRRASKIQKGT